jgi:hypothetical protein
MAVPRKDRTRGKKPTRTARGRRRPPAIPDASPDTLEDVAAAGVEEPHARLTGGDVDADWMRAETSGEEAVGGSVATPDQDVVDEIGRALGVEQDDEAEFRTTDEILHARDRFRWHLERDAEDEARGRPHRRRGSI